MAPPANPKREVHDKFESKPSESAYRRRMSSVAHKKRPNVQVFSSLTPMWAGIAGTPSEQGKKIEIGM